MSTTHITAHLREQWGGMQVMIEAMQRSGDTTVRLFEQEASGLNGEIGLGAGGATTLAILRHNWQLHNCGQPNNLSLYHNAFALSALADIDQSARRAVFIHTISPLITASAPIIAPYVDGVLACGEVPLAYMRRLMPDFPEERFFCCHNGISPPDNLPQRVVSIRNPIRLCYAGRLVRNQKRLDRLPLLIKQLDLLGVQFEMTLIGDGKLLPWLQNECAGDARIRFTGKLEQSTYWDELSRTDVAFLLSDFEGTSIFLLEAMATGAIPIVSNYDCEVAKLDFLQLDPGLLYPVGNMLALAQRIDRLQRMPHNAFAQLARDIARLGRTKTVAQFTSDAHVALDWLNSAPAIAQSIRGRRASPWDILPMGVLRRMRQEHWSKDRFITG